MTKRKSKQPRRDALALQRVESLGIELQQALDDVERRRAALDGLLWLLVFLLAYLFTRRLLRRGAADND